MKIFYLFLLITLPLWTKDVDITPIVKKIDALRAQKKTSPTLNYALFDPFAKAKPLLATKEQPPLMKKSIRPIVVQTILNRRALIDGKWLGVGKRIHGHTITAIKQHDIVVSNGTTTRTIPIKTGKRLIITKEQN